MKLMTEKNSGGARTATRTRRPLWDAAGPVLSWCGAVLYFVACDTSGAGSVDAKVVFPDPDAAALAEVAADGDSARIRELVQAGADPNARGDKGVNLLQWALLNRSKRGLAGLLAAGADAGAPESSGATVMHYAAMANDPDYLEVLLRHRADPNAPNGVTGDTPLMSALMGSREVQFRALLDAGAKPDLADRFGNTSLHVAAKINAFQQVLELLQAGADPTARNRQGRTFQGYLYATPERILSEDGRRGREAIAAWLRDHRVTSEDTAGR
jgi:ankyrin repeat protein